MSDYEELIRDWSNEQGFTVWACDHASVLRNLAKWLDARGDGWVSVKKRLPEEEGDYLTFTTCGDVETNWWDNGWAYEGEVTHWQPLPQPPKGDE